MVKVLGFPFMVVRLSERDKLIQAFSPKSSVRNQKLADLGHRPVDSVKRPCGVGLIREAYD